MTQIISMGIIYILTLGMEWYSSYSGMIKSTENNPDKLSLLLMNLNYVFLIVYGLILLVPSFLFIHNLGLLLAAIFVSIILKTVFSYYTVLSVFKIIVKKEAKKEQDSLKDKVMAPANDMDKEVQDAIKKGVIK